MERGSALRIFREAFSESWIGEDYHNVLRRRLEPVAAAMRDAVEGSETRVCVDTAPVRERYWAVQAGLGFIGLNNLLIVPGAGSKVFLAEIFWTVGVATQNVVVILSKGIIGKQGMTPAGSIGESHAQHTLRAATATIRCTTCRA